MLLASLPPQPDRIATTCAVGASAQSRVLHTPAGEPVTLEIQADDDHSKNSHLCMATYLYKTAKHPEGLTIVTYDGTYGRTLSVEVQGFSPDGRLFGLIRESDSLQPQLFVLLASGDSASNMILSHLYREIPKACQANLQVVAVTSVQAVFQSTAAPCGGRQWSLQLDKGFQGPPPAPVQTPLLQP